MRAYLLSTLLIVSFAIPGSFGTENGFTSTRNPFEFATSKKVGGKRKAGKKAKKGEVEAKVGLIMIIGGEKVAIINGKRYKTGQAFAEYTIKSITLNYVELVSAEDSRRIYVNENFR